MVKQKLKEKDEINEVKTFNIRVPKHIWTFLKNTATEQETSMAEIIIRCVNKYKNKLSNNLNNRLTSEDTHVQ